jgi:hypothetical protein
MKEFIAAIGIILAVIAICVIGWRVDRWINWKFSYGGKVDQRIEKLEKRVDDLEKGLDNSD